MNSVFNLYKAVPKYQTMTFAEFLSNAFEAHHVIPISVLKDSKGLQFYFNNFPNPFKFNEIANAVWVEKKFVHEGIACVIHDSHLDYNKHLVKVIDDYYDLIKNNPLAPQLLDAKITTLIGNGKSLIKQSCISSDPLKINTLRPNF